MCRPMCSRFQPGSRDMRSRPARRSCSETSCWPSRRWLAKRPSRQAVRRPPATPDRARRPSSARLRPSDGRCGVDDGGPRDGRYWPSSGFLIPITISHTATHISICLRMSDPRPPDVVGQPEHDRSLCPSAEPPEADPASAQRRKLARNHRRNDRGAVLRTALTRSARKNAC